VFRIRNAWLASVVAAALMAVMLLSAGGTAAKTPGWGFSAVTVNPSPVGPGNLADYSFSITNSGNSNISALYLSTDIPVSSGLATPAWILEVTYNGQSGPASPCGSNPPTGPLNCDLGALNAGNSIDFQIVFRVPSTSGTYTFNLVATGNGNTPSDSGGTSHGDTLKKAASVSVSGNDEYDAGFTLAGGGTFDTSGTLGKNNPQQSSVTTSQAFAATTIEDSSSFTGSGTDPCSASGVTCIGQWTRVSAPNPDGGALKFVFLVYGKGIPGSVGPSDITLVHVLDDGTVEVIGDSSSERCSSANDSAGAPCIYVTEVGKNFEIVAWLLHNGSLRGQF
jgi:hypothetical protein